MDENAIDELLIDVLEGAGVLDIDEAAVRYEPRCRIVFLILLNAAFRTAVLDAAGSSWNDVVKTTIFLVDMADFAIVNAIYGRAVGDPPPARSTVGVAALPKGAHVEIELIAHLGVAHLG